jgi:hypothetical protein
VNYPQIGPVNAPCGASGGGVAGPVFAQLVGDILLDIGQRRAIGDTVFERPIKVDQRLPRSSSALRWRIALS